MYDRENDQFAYAVRGEKLWSSYFFQTSGLAIIFNFQHHLELSNIHWNCLSTIEIVENSCLWMVTHPLYAKYHVVFLRGQC